MKKNTDKWALLRNTRLLKKELRKLNNELDKELTKIKHKFKVPDNKKGTE